MIVPCPKQCFTFITFMVSGKIAKLQILTCQALNWLAGQPFITTQTHIFITQKGVDQRSKYVTQVQQQRRESPTVTFTWHACTYYVHKLHPRYQRHTDSAQVPWASFCFRFATFCYMSQKTKTNQKKKTHSPTLPEAKLLKLTVSLGLQHKQS